MGKFTLTLIIGVLISVPLIYLLQLKGPGAITLLIFLCVGLTFIIRSLFNFIFKKKTQKSNDNPNDNDQ